MNIHVRSAKIVDPASTDHLKTRDILIRNGKIEKIGSRIKIDPSIRTFEGQNLHVSPGWFDMYVCFFDPGFEYKEDIGTGMAAAMAGGFTGVACM
ncbi:MAG: dihydroorotase, partial [Bacteroidetes bacterium]|nr:dihydroorotase [Bacteroidota bacterium]